MVGIPKAHPEHSLHIDVQNADLRDGPLDARHRLKEAPSKNYVRRTEWNVRDCDGTMVFSIVARHTGRSRKTVDLAWKHGRSCLQIAAQV